VKVNVRDHGAVFGIALTDRGSTNRNSWNPHGVVGRHEIAPALFAVFDRSNATARSLAARSARTSIPLV
jgi:hypothetical protein